MKSLIDSYKKTGNLHHAYALEGDKKTAISNLYNFFENDLNIETKANLDFYFHEFENFGINDGRIIQDLASRKSFVKGMQIFVIAISSITVEAQNALLKLFEEPAEGVHFFIIIPTSEIFLSTLRSRLNILYQGAPLMHTNALVDEFMRVSGDKRLKLLGDIIENKDKIQSIDFLNDLESVLYKNKSKNGHWTNKDVGVFETIQKSRDYLRGRAPSVKMLLENIALNV